MNLGSMLHGVWFRDRRRQLREERKEAYRG